MRYLIITVLGCLVSFQAALGISRDSTDFTPVNLGSGVNSKYDDLKPIISPDGLTLYICRKDAPENIGGGGEDIWMSTRMPDGEWGMAVNLGTVLNNRGNNSVCSITPDGNTMLLVDAYSDPSERRRTIAIAHRTAGGWSAPQPVVIEKYTNLSKYSEFALSNDNAALVLAIQTERSYGDRDLYVSFRTANGTFSEPVSLGSVVNSAGQEATPFLAADNTSLYFASDRPGGFGEFDIYVTRRLDSTWTNWSVPENLGPTVNTDDWDLAYTIPADGKDAYFVSYNNSLGGADIFQVKLPEKVRPKPVVLLSGKVINRKTQQPVETDIVYDVLSTGVEVGRARSTPSSGEYKVTLPAGESYALRADAPGYLSVNENLDFSAFSEYTELSKDLYLVPIEKGITVELKNIFFDRKMATLQPASYAELRRLVQLMNDNPSLKIQISGHTDAMGKDADNLTLSNDRAQSVRTYLINEGSIDASRLKAVGYGETKPVATNDTEEGRALNRRVELTILEK
jgi:outer membrane protein OmpA-like peptidoglycan-associated protein